MALKATDALLAVDVQRDFLPGGSLAVADGDAILQPIAHCIGAFAKHGLPVLASRDWHPADHCSFRENGGPWPPHCVAGTRGAEIHPAIGLPGNAIVIDKATTTDKDAYSAFDSTNLDEQLKAAGVERLFIGGLATDICVLNTARDALELGYQVVLVLDAMRGIDAANSKEAIRSLEQRNATVTESSTMADTRE